MKYALLVCPALFAGLLLSGCVQEEDDSPGSVFSVEKLHFSEGSGLMFFDIGVDGAWSLASPGWIECTPVSGEGPATVSVTSEANNDYDRSGEIVLTHGGMTASLPVSQDGKKGPGRENGVPTYPVPVSPASGDTDVKINTSFSWQESVDPDGDPLTYTIEVSYDAGDTWQTVGTSSSSGVRGSLLLEKESGCLWRVRAEDGYGGGGVYGGRRVPPGGGGGGAGGGGVGRRGRSPRGAFPPSASSPAGSRTLFCRCPMPSEFFPPP